MIDLYNNKYDRETLKQNIYAVKLIDILKTQTIDVSFVVRYILNENYQLLSGEKDSLNQELLNLKSEYDELMEIYELKKSEDIQLKSLYKFHFK